MDQTKPLFKRVKERSVWEAKQSVDQWRNLFEYGLMDASGNKIKFTLQQAAEQVGIPKKTLEDYHQLLRKVEKITPLESLKDKKMGYLRQFLKENKSKIKYEADIEEEEEEVQLQMQQVQQVFAEPPAPFQYNQNEGFPEASQQQANAQPENFNWEQMIIEGDIQKQQDSDCEFYPSYQPRQVHLWDGEEFKDQSLNQRGFQYHYENQFHYSTYQVSFVFLPDHSFEPALSTKTKIDSLIKHYQIPEEENNEDKETSPDDDDEDYQKDQYFED